MMGVCGEVAGGGGGTRSRVIFSICNDCTSLAEAGGRMYWGCSFLPARLSFASSTKSWPPMARRGLSAELLKGGLRAWMYTLKGHIKPFQTQTQRRLGRCVRTTDSCGRGSHPHYLTTSATNVPVTTAAANSLAVQREAFVYRTTHAASRTYTVDALVIGEYGRKKENDITVKLEELGINGTTLYSFRAVIGSPYSRIIWVGTLSYEMRLSSVSVMQALIRSSPNAMASWLILSASSGRQLHPTPNPPSLSDGEHSRSTLSHLRSFVGAGGYMLAEAKLSKGQHAKLSLIFTSTACSLSPASSTCSPPQFDPWARPSLPNTTLDLVGQEQWSRNPLQIKSTFTVCGEPDCQPLSSAACGVAQPGPPKSPSGMALSVASIFDVDTDLPSEHSPTKNLRSRVSMDPECFGMSDSTCVSEY
ncbi:uncharacterized protein ARMOST_04281 [Armillaria ostoyae]|uniref:Uncharacterized protein n=1 Tax=Armillaria ostoyae TaxID=47428 RepID=A0A284QWY2_ARMOS|nr:uncharacterized protein ARMOST_04281 [Armillaria ostoyae]